MNDSNFRVPDLAAIKRSDANALAMAKRVGLFFVGAISLIVLSGIFIPEIGQMLKNWKTHYIPRPESGKSLTSSKPFFGEIPKDQR